MTMILQREVGGAATVAAPTSNATRLTCSIAGASAVVEFSASNDPQKRNWWSVLRLSTDSVLTFEKDFIDVQAEHIKADVISGNPIVSVSGV